MKIHISLLRSLLGGAQFYNCPEVSFGHVDVLRYSSNTVKIDYLESVLYCATKASMPNDFTWYGQLFDRHEHLDILISTHPQWVFMVDDVSIMDKYPDASIILVADVYVSVNILYKYVLETVSPCICGITGSVGKTTTVGLLEDMFTGLGKGVLRIYSKRITPLSLFDSVINHLDLQHCFVVMEYSLYQDWHIATLVDLLPPFVSGILNIMNSHIGVGSIASPEDIFRAKSKLLIRSRKSFVPVGLRQFCDEEGLYVDFFDPDQLLIDTRIKPFVSTKLWYVQASLALLIIRNCVIDLDEAKIIELINNHVPKERRLMKITSEEVTFFFDGDATNASRLYQLAENLYLETVLMICDVDFGEEPLEPQRELLGETFSRFGCVYICDNLNPRYDTFVREIAGKHTHVKFEKIETVIGVVSGLIKDGKILFVHHGSYWRNKLGTEHDLNRMFSF